MQGAGNVVGGYRGDVSIFSSLPGSPCCNWFVCFVPSVPGMSETAQLLRARKLTCDDLCLSLKRASDFGAAVFGKSGPPAEVCPYPDDLLVHAFQNQNLVQKCEKLIRAFVTDRTASGMLCCGVLCPRCAHGGRALVLPLYRG
jgi:hypothetical protein